MSRAHRGVAEGLGQKGLTHADRADKEDVLVTVKEVQGEDSIEQTAVHGYLGRPVKVLQAADLLESRRMEMDFQVAVITPGYLVSQQYL